MRQENGVGGRINLVKISTCRFTVAYLPLDFIVIPGCLINPVSLGIGKLLIFWIFRNGFIEILYSFHPSFIMSLIVCVGDNSERIGKVF